MIAMREELAHQGRGLEGATVAMQGFGNVGSHAARLLAERGARVVAVADHAGAVRRDGGLDVPALVVLAASAMMTAAIVFDAIESLPVDCRLRPFYAETAATRQSQPGRASAAIRRASAASRLISS